jgi:REP element-mobilizing transposase RayT
MLHAVGGRGRPPYTMVHDASLLAKYRYRRRLPHLQKADADLFVTFCTARWQLPNAAREIVLEHCLREGGLRMAGEAARPAPAPRIHLHAIVVMPDHVHLLLQPLRDANGWPVPLVDILQCMKSTTAHRINKQLGHSGPVWEEESFDHVLRSAESLKEKAEYIRQNPARRKLVRRPEDYRWLWVDPELKLSIW